MADKQIAPKIIQRLAEWSSDPELQFSRSALFQARLCFIDTYACMVNGANEPVTRKTAEAMCKSGAKGFACAVNARKKLSAPVAALVNGTAAHALDFDDYELPASTHPSAVIIPALFALNDLKQKSLDNLLHAYLVGFETIIRIGQALGGYEHYLKGWHATATIGSFGATAAASNFLGLSTNNTTMALGICCSMAAGLKVQIGTDVKALHAGFAAKSGIEAALLANEGINANVCAMEDPFGFLDQYGGDNPELNVNIGNAMDIYGVQRKPWPACAYTHRIIEAALNLANSESYSASDIVSGSIRIPEPYLRVSPFLNPSSSSEARFSILYCTAAALLDQALGPSSFELVSITRPSVRNLMNKLLIDAYEVPSSLGDMDPEFPDSLSIVFKSGEKRTETISYVKGGVRNPLGLGEVCKKFFSCCGNNRVLNDLLSGDSANVFNPWPEGINS